MDKVFITRSSEETSTLGQKIGNDIRGGEIIALIGGLGAGKTTFIQGLAKGLNIDSRVISPTFILMRSYTVEPKTNEVPTTLYHLDLYRLEENIEDEIKNLGLFDLWGRKENVVVIEWADKAKEVFPQNTMWIEIENTSEDERRITIK